MLRRCVLILSLLLVGINAACFLALSLQPFYTEKDLIFDPRLVGTWMNTDSDTDPPLTIQKSGENAYTLKSPKSTGQVAIALKLHLMRLGKTEFVDAILDDENENADSEGVLLFAIPGHLLGRISITPDRVKIDWLDDEWLRKANKNKNSPVTICPSENQDRLLLCASTADLQAFALRYTGNDAVFAVHTDLTRKK